jgi:thymidine phosphorylase
MVLGAGREHAEDDVDHAVGVICRAKPGETVKAGDTIYEAHYRDEWKLSAALPLLESSFRISDSPYIETSLVLEEMGPLT